MLDYAIEHQEAIDTVTQCRDLGLQNFKLNDEQWAIAEQLRGVLKVSHGPGNIRTTHGLTFVYVDSKGCNTIFLPLDTYYSDGSHR
jgi:hypothetical protein